MSDKDNNDEHDEVFGAFELPQGMDIRAVIEKMREMLSAAGIPSEVIEGMSSPDDMARDMEEAFAIIESMKRAGQMSGPYELLHDICGLESLRQDEDEQLEGPAAAAFADVAKQMTNIVADYDEMPKLPPDARRALHNMLCNAISMGFGSGILFERERQPKSIGEQGAQELRDLFGGDFEDLPVLDSDPEVQFTDDENGQPDA